MTADLGPAARPRPVPSPEDRMHAARTDTDHLDVAAELIDAGLPHDVATWLAARDARTAPTFRTWMSDTERDEATEERDLLRAENANLTAGLRRLREQLAEAGIEIYRQRQQLGAAGEVLAVVRDAAERSAAASVPPRRAQELPTAANLAEHLSTHQWYSKPEFPLLHEPSAHREHIYNSDCAICRGDLSRIAAVALAYMQTTP